jgi:hypothetical protein
LGLSRTDTAHASAVYVAAAASAHIDMREGDLWKPELREVDPEHLGHITKAQGTYTQHMHAA